MRSNAGIRVEPQARLSHDAPWTWLAADRGASGDDQWVKFFIARGDNERQAKACWATNLRHAKRLHCTVWEAPEGWQRGQPLNSVAQYVVDDRSTRSEEGLIHYRSF